LRRLTTSLSLCRRQPNEMPTRPLQPATSSARVSRCSSRCGHRGAEATGARIGRTKDWILARLLPGTTDGMSATTITLGAGDERGGIDLVIAMVRRGNSRRGDRASGYRRGFGAGHARVGLSARTPPNFSAGTPDVERRRREVLLCERPGGAVQRLRPRRWSVFTPGGRRMAAPEPSEASNYWALVELRVMAGILMCR